MSTAADRRLARQARREAVRKGEVPEPLPDDDAAQETATEAPKKAPAKKAPAKKKAAAKKAAPRKTTPKNGS